MLRPRALTFKTTYAPDSDTFVTFDTAGRTTSAPPPFSLVFGRRIFDDITAVSSFVLYFFLLPIDSLNTPPFRRFPLDQELIR